MTSKPQGGFITLGSAITTPDMEYVQLSDLLNTDEYPQVITSDLRPAQVTGIEYQGVQLTTIVVSESGAGISGTADHKVMLAKPVENGVTLEHASLSSIEVGDRVFNLRDVREDENGDFLMDFHTPAVETVRPAGLEEVYAITVDRKVDGILINGLVSLQWDA